MAAIWLQSTFWTSNFSDSPATAADWVEFYPGTVYWTSETPKSPEFAQLLADLRFFAKLALSRRHLPPETPKNESPARIRPKNSAIWTWIRRLTNAPPNLAKFGPKGEDTA